MQEGAGGHRLYPCVQYCVFIMQVILAGHIISAGVTPCRLVNGTSCIV